MSAVDTRLWCLHHIGPDDVHPAPDFETAQRWADHANAHLTPGFEDISRFVVAVWPWSDESHAAGLEQSIAGWTMGDGTPVKSPKDELLATLEIMLEHYVRLAGCGDCGNWDPEDEAEVKQARLVIARAKVTAA